MSNEQKIILLEERVKDLEDIVKKLIDHAETQTAINKQVCDCNALLLKLLSK